MLVQQRCQPFDASYPPLDAFVEHHLTCLTNNNTFAIISRPEGDPEVRKG